MKSHKFRRAFSLPILLTPEEQHEQFHIRKAEHNLRHLGDLEQKLPVFPDWCITVAFYVALHYVEAFFAKKSIFPQDAVHEMRNRTINNSPEPELKKIQGRYLALYSRSKVARYNPQSHMFLAKDAPLFIRDGTQEIPKLLGYAQQVTKPGAATTSSTSSPTPAPDGKQHRNRSDDKATEPK
jgi:hypothetical protein